MGHRAGDRCIKMVANLAKSSFRQDDVIGRYGGDEFLVILPSTPPARAFTIAEQFRRLVQTNTSQVNCVQLEFRHTRMTEKLLQNL